MQQNICKLELCSSATSWTCILTFFLNLLLKVVWLYFLYIFLVWFAPFGWLYYFRPFLPSSGQFYPSSFWAKPGIELTSKDHGSDCESSTFTARSGSFPIIIFSDNKHPQILKINLFIHSNSSSIVKNKIRFKAFVLNESSWYENWWKFIFKMLYILLYR